MPINSTPPNSDLLPRPNPSLKKTDPRRRTCPGPSRTRPPPPLVHSAPATWRRRPPPPAARGGPRPAPDAALPGQRSAAAASLLPRLRSTASSPARAPSPAGAASPRRPASPRLGSGRAPPSSSSSSHAGLLPRQVRRAATVTPACIGKRADLDPDLRNSSRLTFPPNPSFLCII